jgi:hypothetical protein
VVSFDTIPHCELMQCVVRRIVDRNVLRLIKMWLMVPVAEQDENGKRRLTGGKDHHCGTPQGGVVTPRTQKITSSLNDGWNFGGNRVRIDVCRIRLYVYDRCHAPASPRRPNVSIARATCCCMAAQVHAASAPGLVRRSLSQRITWSKDDTPHSPAPGFGSPSPLNPAIDHKSQAFEFSDQTRYI